MANIYRKSLLDKMSSPDQLDKMVVITKPSYWLACLGGVIVIIVALIWSIVGSLPEKVDASGVFVSDSNSTVVSAELAGIVKTVNVEAGDKVNAGDVLYTLDSKSYDSAIDKLNKKLSQVYAVTLTSTNDPKTSETQAMLQAKAQVQAASSSSSAEAYVIQRSKTDEAKALYEEAQKQYKEGKITEEELNLAKDNYQNNLNTLSQYESSNASIKAYADQFAAAKGSAISQIQDEIDKYKEEAEHGTVKAPIAGIVTNLNVAKGAAISQGSSALIIHENGGEGVAICYVPITSAKKVQPGMKVNIYPSNYNRQEYGHILAKVDSVDEYASTETEIFDELGDATIVQSLLANGPVVAITCKFDKDKTSASGYKWSTKKGSEVEVAQNTFVTAEIITSSKKPITLLLPFLKEKLENVTKADDNSSK